MRRARAVAPAFVSAFASVVAVAGLVACGSPESEAPDADTSVPAGGGFGPQSVAPDPLLGSTITDPIVLESSMLAAQELPAGYAAIPDPVRDLGLDPAPDYDSPDRSGTDPDECANVLAPISEQRADASSDAVVRYSGPNFSSIDEDAASYLDDEVAQVFGAVQETFAGCATYTGTDADGFAVDYRLEPRDQETIGDASASVRLTTTSEGFSLVSEAVVAVVDRTVMQLVVTSQEGADPAAVTDLAKTAAEKIRGANTGV